MSSMLLGKILREPSRGFLAVGSIVLGIFLWGICERRLEDAWLFVPPPHPSGLLHGIFFFSPAILFARLPRDVRWLDRHRGVALLIFSITYACYLFCLVPNFS